jgi:hypothetical protein
MRHRYEPRSRYAPGGLSPDRATNSTFDYYPIGTDNQLIVPLTLSGGYAPIVDTTFGRSVARLIGRKAQCWSGGTTDSREVVTWLPSA